MKTPEQFIESLRKLNLEVYLLGERVKNPVDHPIIRPSLNSVAMTFQLAQEEEFKDLVTVASHMTGKVVNRFTAIHHSPQDLVNKVKMQRALGQKTASCFQRCVGMDAMNALYSTTFETDQKYQTPYHRRFKDFLLQVQENDWVVDGAMTDVKGDRGLRPVQQSDPDLFLRIVERRKDGVIVRGAKAHQTGMVNSHEVIVMPTMALRDDEKDYAISFAVPTDSKNLFFIYGRQSCDTRKLEGSTIDVGNHRFGGHEVLAIFDNVFVPLDRIFLCGETDFVGILVERFAGYHRQSYGGCKVGVGDVLIGAASLAADMNGTAKASHVVDKVIEMVHLNETLYSCGLACSYEGHPTTAGNCEIDMLLANVCKQNVTRFPYEIARLAEDIAGGLMVTMPSEKDLHNERTAPYIRKYLQGTSSVPTEYRMRIFRLIENITLGTAAVGYRTESMHGAGPPQAQRIMIRRQADLEAKKNLARSIAGIK
jgi:4-hydroxybutyryl-CoA dehydratase / vinylacetyl-CoA-Delta-isomerase